MTVYHTRQAHSGRGDSRILCLDLVCVRKEDARLKGEQYVLSFSALTRSLAFCLPQTGHYTVLTSA